MHAQAALPNTKQLWYAEIQNLRIRLYLELGSLNRELHTSMLVLKTLSSIAAHQTYWHEKHNLLISTALGLVYAEYSEEILAHTTQ